MSSIRKDSATAATNSRDCCDNGILLRGRSSLRVERDFANNVRTCSDSIDIASRGTVFSRINDFVGDDLLLRGKTGLATRDNVFAGGAVRVGRGTSLALAKVPSMKGPKCCSPIVSAARKVRLNRQTDLSIGGVNCLDSGVVTRSSTTVVGLKSDGTAVKGASSPLFGALVEKCGTILRNGVVKPRDSIGVGGTL